jgi:hypothetical protein
VSLESNSNVEDTSGISFALLSVIRGHPGVGRANGRREPGCVMSYLQANSLRVAP